MSRKAHKTSGQSPKTKNKFSDDLREWRGSQTQSLAANSLDVDLATYRNWEQGRNIPNNYVRSFLCASMRRLSQGVDSTTVLLSSKSKT
jgi:DNA-binding transcriptional regulator YiaG